MWRQLLPIPSCRLSTQPAIETALEMQLPCPGFLDHATQISTWRCDFACTMLFERENQRCCRDLRPKPVLRYVPGVLRDADHRPELPRNAVQIAPILQISAHIVRPGRKLRTGLHDGTVALVCLGCFRPRKGGLTRGREKLADELDLASDPCLFVIDVAAFNDPGRVSIPLSVALADRKDRKL